MALHTPAQHGKPHFSLYNFIISSNSSPFWYGQKPCLNLAAIALVTSLIHEQTKDLETPNKLAIVRYSAVDPIK